VATIPERSGCANPKLMTIPLTIRDATRVSGRVRLKTPACAAMLNFRTQ
jgi:hypothetical protein